MSHSLDRDHSLSSLLRFAMPTVLMMMFLSLYTIVDGIFVARFVNATALSALNIAYPPVSVTIGIGVMLATGGNAIVARKMGEGKPEEARRLFSLFVLVGIAIGLLIVLVGLLWAEPICIALGATQELLPYCMDYLRPILFFAPCCILQCMFQSFFVTAGRPALGLMVTVWAGLSNIVLDYVLIVPCDLGISGAAVATGLGNCVTAVIGLLFFFQQDKELHFALPKWEGSTLLQACGNGSSELVSNLANAVVIFRFNQLMLQLLGEDGVAAVTIILYAQFLLNSFYLGFSLGVAPVIGFQYGARRNDRLKGVFRSCSLFLLGSSVLVYGLSLAIAPVVVGVFSPQGTAVYDIALAGFYLFTPAFLVAGFNIFASGLFTALSNGLASALVSFARTFGFLLLALLVLPQLLEVDGVFLAVPVAEGLCLFLSAGVVLAHRKKYGYC